ncbi:glycoside hydrolase family 95 protein [Saccharata proteae CBS 121410]|uniref:Glycoside hydrolase family 95 protein n=1 Tax=Saccharata proteae CBS 121410 TaxID=1314787 RepID=A0A9P4I0N6_9PEZI|nr:glycoside hydrolase family 95 protein [Saccharata proteae CBS 121410]
MSLYLLFHVVILSPSLFFSPGSASSARVLWSSTPATYTNIPYEAYPLGNGRIGAWPFGSPGKEKLSLNVDSLWSGGPFQLRNYTGGNPSSEQGRHLPGIRDWVFGNGSGNVTELYGGAQGYGSFRVLGNLTVRVGEAGFGDGMTGFRRSLDLGTGLHRTRFRGSDGRVYQSVVYCSFPDRVCVYGLSSDTALPTVTVAFENVLAPELQELSCGDGYARIRGLTQVGPPVGMRYDAVARVAGVHEGSTYCSNETVGALVIPQMSNRTSLQLVVGAGTDYDQKAGNSESHFGFRGEDPARYVEEITRRAANRGPGLLLKDHIADFEALSNQFHLELPDPLDSADTETSKLIARYNTTPGDPYVDGLLFDYARYLLISSSRENSLPANLQGKWSQTLEGAWDADYHVNINLQMNYWHADQTGLGGLQKGLWDFMEDTWVPRGEETARLVYGGEGWTIHDAINVFGHTAMQDDAQWANYPAAAAWMMQHVWDHFEYSQDIKWFRDQGYPLIKGHARFWLSQLVPDAFFNDSTLVVNPCNSPEHGPTTFGCTHYQQLIQQLFTYILYARDLGIETDTAFVSKVESALAHLDTGIHLSSFGSIKEWKLPDGYGYDFPNDTHRHLSNLYGWFPGYSIAGLANGYANTTIQSAIATSLYSRGNGTGADADSGWEKMWRAACWARLNNTDEADGELRYAVGRNFAGNGLSTYGPWSSGPFQIDANFGVAGAVLGMLVVDLPGSEVVVVGGAIPSRWGGGSVKGLRLRGGGQVDFEWDDDGVVVAASVSGRDRNLKLVNKQGVVFVEI